MYDVIIYILLSYAIGSIPFGLVIGWITKKQDIRRLGTQNAGASNTFIVIGPFAALITALFDIGKGLLIAAGAWFLYQDEFIVSIASLAVIMGHIFPLFFSFRGGKGVATAFGVMLFISWPLVIGCLLSWACIVLITRYVALSNVFAYILLPLYGLFMSDLSRIYLIYMLSVALLMVFSHRQNILRFFQGKEETLTEWLRSKKRNR